MSMCRKPHVWDWTEAICYMYKRKCDILNEINKIILEHFQAYAKDQMIKNPNLFIAW